MIFLLIFLWLAVGAYFFWLTVTSIDPMFTTSELFPMLLFSVFGPLGIIYWLTFGKPFGSKPIKWLSRKSR